jgi:uncharacterized protein YcfJ
MKNIICLFIIATSLSVVPVSSVTSEKIDQNCKTFNSLVLSDVMIENFSGSGQETCIGGAAIGALIGAHGGSIIPGVGTAAGLIIGAMLGAWQGCRD